MTSNKISVEQYRLFDSAQYILLKHLWCSLLCLFLLLCSNRHAFVHSWRNHDVSTLKLLQIVHTHGERTPSHFVHNDPYADISTFWLEGVGQLTKAGRNRMFHVGEFLRQAYGDFLQNQSDVLEQYLYVRSSGSRRCLESASLLVNGLLGGVKDNPFWQKPVPTNSLTNYSYLSNYWRPIPVHSIYPKGSDPMLDSIATCPNSDFELEDMQRKNDKLSSIYEENDEFLQEISLFAGEKIDTLAKAYSFYQELSIEMQYHYHWWKEPYSIWSQDYEAYIINKLRKLSQLYWSIQFNNKIIQTLRGGVLIKELNDNIRHFIKGTDRRRKINVYSTHDRMIATILQALHLYNGHLIPPGATLLIELHYRASDQHESTGNFEENDRTLKNYFLRVYYFNETYTTNWAYRMISNIVCKPSISNGTDKQRCPVSHYFAQTFALEPYDWQYQCGNKVRMVNYFAINLFILGANFLCMLMLLIVLRIHSSNIRNHCNNATLKIEK